MRIIIIYWGLKWEIKLINTVIGKTQIPGFGDLVLRGQEWIVYSSRGSVSESSQAQ